MANLNCVHLIGRLTRDVEVKTTANSKVAKLGFAISNRKKDQSGQWVDDPCYLDVEVWNRGEGFKMADFVADKCRKGSQLFIDGRLSLDTWEDKNGGGKRSKVKIIAENIQLLDGKPQDGQQQGGGGPSEPQHEPAASGGGSGGEIPF